MKNGGSKEFVRLAQECGALAFDKHTLKSGRSSPYFLDVSMLATVVAAATLAKLYADMVAEVAEEMEQSATLLGVPYKGIPLAAVTCAELARRDGLEDRFSFAYLRKEEKDHGEKGLLAGKVDKNTPLWLVDDVLTAGTAVKRSLKILEDMGYMVKGLLVAFDRMERAQEDDSLSTSQMLKEVHDLEVRSIATVKDLIEQTDDDVQSELIRGHLRQYGVA